MAAEHHDQDTPPDVDHDPSLDPVVDEFLTASRALVALAIRSVNASPVDVTLMQHRVLVLLSSRGEQTVSELAEELGVNASNASRVCDRLQRLALVARQRSTTDARSVRISVTDDGRAVLRAVHAHRRAEVRAVLANLSADEARAAVAALRAFNDAAHEAAEGDWMVLDTTSAPSEAGRT
ncbi:MarR family winged helix-turn-helix transcriptional regulator [Nocardioides rubriscoriae]|uniref:MarR family winged helix-turn-helix transcriptional regulator n=1 Tax=Nocardioides rubriscoriae TaxID=642762 RepID=UPI0011DF7DF6|nr:MarR family transcriptional regulator [Nocardioides rubriscoriae]